MSHSPNPNDQNDQNLDPSSFQSRRSRSLSLPEFFFKEQALKHVILKMHHHHHHNQNQNNHNSHSNHNHHISLSPTPSPPSSPDPTTPSSTTDLTALRQQVEGFFFDVGLLGPYGKHAEDVASMPRTLQSMPRTAEDVAKHA